MKYDDVNLIQRTLEGDQQAFTTLVEKYQKQIHALAWQKIGDFHIAQEITQDAFLTAYQKLATLTHHSQFSGWIYAITSNKCKNWHRKKRSTFQSLQTINPVELEEAYYLEYITRQREEAANQKRRAIVQKLLSKLQESDRTIVNLFYIAEMTCEDIGRFLGVSPNTVRSRLHRARNRLKKEEAMIKENLSSFQLPTQFTENITKEISRLNPITPSGSKPLVPIAVSAAAAVLILLLMGAGMQYLNRFQKPYSLNAQSEPTIEITDTQLVIDTPTKPAVRTQVGRSNVTGRTEGGGQKPDTPLFAAAQVDDAAISKTAPQWIQTNVPEGGSVNTLFSTTQGDIFAETTTTLYKLSDNGQKWKPVKIWDAPSLRWTDWAIGGRRMIEANDTLYIITNEEIWASIDRGETWNSLGTHPEGPPIGLVITDAGSYLGLADGIYRSEDGTAPWILLKDGMEPGKIKAIAAVENTVFAGTNNGLYRLKAGVWQKVSIRQIDNAEQNQVVHALAVSENQLYVAAGKKFEYRSGMQHQSEFTDESWWSLYRSTDLGNSWDSIDPRKSPINEVKSNGKLSINYPPNGTNVALGSTINIIAKKEKVMVAVPTELFYSTNTGETWNYFSLNDRMDIGIPPPVLMMDGESFYKVGEAGIYRTTDGVKSWHLLNTGLASTTVTKIVAVNNQLYARTTNEIITSVDGGESWTPLSIDAKNIFVMAGFNDELYIRQYMRNLKNAPPILRLSTEDNELTSIPNMPVSEGFDYIFQERVPPPFIHLGSFAISGDTYYVEYGHKLYRWKLGTTKWYDTGLMGKKKLLHRFSPPMSNGNPFYMPPSLISPDSMSFKIAVAGENIYVGKRDGHLMHSLDEGKTWNDLTDHLPFPVKSYNTIVFAGNFVFVATDKGVLLSANGTDWHTLTDVEKTPLVTNRLVVDGTTVYCETKQKIYQLNRNIGIWQPVTPEIPYPVSSFDVDNNTLYAGTFGGGVLRFSLDN